MYFFLTCTISTAPFRPGYSKSPTPMDTPLMNPGVPPAASVGVIWPRKAPALDSDATHQYRSQCLANREARDNFHDLPKMQTFFEIRANPCRLKDRDLHSAEPGGRIRRSASIAEHVSVPPSSRKITLIGLNLEFVVRKSWYGHLPPARNSRQVVTQATTLSQSEGEQQRKVNVVTAGHATQRIFAAAGALNRGSGYV